eukprot:scaffold51082_cov30-Tisochrysis_lutea.AAC.1
MPNALAHGGRRPPPQPHMMRGRGWAEAAGAEELRSAARGEARVLEPWAQPSGDRTVNWKSAEASCRKWMGGKERQGSERAQRLERERQVAWKDRENKEECRPQERRGSKLSLALSQCLRREGKGETAPSLHAVAVRWGRRERFAALGP